MLDSEADGKVANVEPGTIIYLNGSSSAGKSTLARAIQDAYEAPILDVGIDTLFGAVQTTYIRAYRHGSPDLDSWRGTAWRLDENERVLAIDFDDWGRRWTYGLHAMVAALAREGNHVVVDDVIFEPEMLDHAAHALAGMQAYLVGVHCSLEVLEQRERDRGDRLMGLARYLHVKPHAHVPVYDVEVDTAHLSPEDAAAVVLERVRSGGPPLAFRQIAEVPTARAG